LTACSLSTLGRCVHVKPEAKRATVQAGRRWLVVDRETQVHGLAATGGMVSETGVAGLTPGGAVRDIEVRYAEWFNQLDAKVVLVRPDFHVFGTAKRLDGANHVVLDLWAHIIRLDGSRLASNGLRAG
jgi:hypothetical protein